MTPTPASLSITPFSPHQFPTKPPRQPRKQTQQQQYHRQRNLSLIPASVPLSRGNRNAKPVMHKKTYIGSAVESLATELYGAEIHFPGWKNIILPEIGKERREIGGGGEGYIRRREPSEDSLRK